MIRQVQLYIRQPIQTPRHRQTHKLVINLQEDAHPEGGRRVVDGPLERFDFGAKVAEEVDEREDRVDALDVGLLQGEVGVVVRWMGGGGFEGVVEVGVSCVWEGGEDGGCGAWEEDGVYGWEDEVLEGGFEVEGEVGCAGRGAADAFAEVEPP